jgi:hypothetical protein
MRTAGAIEHELRSATPELHALGNLVSFELRRGQPRAQQQTGQQPMEGESYFMSAVRAIPN